MEELTQKEIDEAIEKRKKEIGELHPTVRNMLELFCACGTCLENMVRMCIEKPDELGKILEDEDQKESMLSMAAFMHSMIKCAKPLVDFGRGKTNMLAIMMAAKLNELSKKKEENENSGENT